MNKDGGIDFDRVEKIQAINSFSPEIDVPYYDPKEHVLFNVANELFLISTDDLMCMNDNIESFHLHEGAFEQILTTDELRFAWFDHRHLAKKFYCLRDDDYDLYMATNNEDTPVFIVFKSSERKCNRLEADNKSENSGDNIDRAA